MGYWCIFVAFLLLTGCSKRDNDVDKAVSAEVVFKDDFERTALGENWLDTGGGYKIVNGELRVQGARNKPLWLRKKLPRNASITFKARSMSPAVDIKAEVYGDGTSRATALSYKATSYVVILGGWNNTRSIIARMDEHGKDRRSRTTPSAVTGKQYQFKVERRGNRFDWFLDGKQFLSLEDPNPLEGEGHEYFAFNNWMSEVFFDDIVIRPI